MKLLRLWRRRAERPRSFIPDIPGYHGLVPPPIPWPAAVLGELRATHGIEIDNEMSPEQAARYIVSQMKTKVIAGVMGQMARDEATKEPHE